MFEPLLGHDPIVLLRAKVETVDDETKQFSFEHSGEVKSYLIKAHPFDVLDIGYVKCLVLHVNREKKEALLMPYSGTTPEICAPFSLLSNIYFEPFLCLEPSYA